MRPAVGRAPIPLRHRYRQGRSVSMPVPPRIDTCPDRCPLSRRDRSVGVAVCRRRAGGAHLVVRPRADGYVGDDRSDVPAVTRRPPPVGKRPVLEYPCVCARAERCGDVRGGAPRSAEPLPAYGVAAQFVGSFDCRSKLRGVDATVEFATGVPAGVNRSSGSAVRLPTMVMMVAAPPGGTWRGRPARHVTSDGQPGPVAVLSRVRWPNEAMDCPGRVSRAHQGRAGGVPDSR
ncbi:hypothetical protein GON09_005139 [Rhodococcus sp. B50]|nr:hypothetical protein [Rhodococcus sp. B50]